MGKNISIGKTIAYPYPKRDKRIDGMIIKIFDSIQEHRNHKYDIVCECNNIKYGMLSEEICVVSGDSIEDRYYFDFKDGWETKMPFIIESE